MRKAALEDPWIEPLACEPVEITENAQARVLGLSRLENLNQAPEVLIENFDDSIGNICTVDSRNTNSA